MASPLSLPPAPPPPPTTGQSIPAAAESRFLLLTKKMTKPKIISAATTPPATPPAMAPVEWLPPPELALASTGWMIGTGTVEEDVMVTPLEVIVTNEVENEVEVR